MNQINWNDYEWYVLNVLTGKEEFIKDYICRDFGADIKIKLPKKKMLERYRGKYCERLRILFPGYLFVLFSKTIDRRD